MKITILPILKDNYAYILQAKDGLAAVIDPGDAAPVIAYLEDNGLQLDFILNTHHHWDHTDGNAEMKSRYGCPLAGPIYEQDRIPEMDILLREGQDFHYHDEIIKIFHTPGHTSGHICLYLPDSTAAFTADTLFSMGCGRLFEGTAEDLFNSFVKLQDLPGDTMIYPGHEYTIANAKFCLSIEPENQTLQKRYEDVKNLRREKRPTIPVSLDTERATNVFLRAKTAQDLAKLRELKDRA